MSTRTETPTWAAAIGRIPSGLFVITVKSRHGETGMLGSWVQQCSFDPPQLTVAVRKGRYLIDWLTDGTPFVVNVIPEGGKALLTHFGKGFDPGEPAFEGLEIVRPDDSAAVLPTALAWVDCRVTGHFDAGDHVLILGLIVGGAVLHEGKPTTHVRKDGLRY